MRDVHPDTESAINNGAPEIILLRVNFAQGDLFFTDAPFDVYNPADGNTYEGGGALMSVSKVSTKTHLVKTTKTIKFSGVTNTIKSLILNQTQVNREIIEYKAVLDDNYQIVGDVFIEWQGIITKLKSKGDKKKPFVQITAGGVMDDFDRRVNRMTTSASQQRHFPADTGMRFASETNKEIKWGVE